MRRSFATALAAPLAVIGLLGLAACNNPPGVGGDLGAMLGDALGQNLDTQNRRRVQRMAVQTGRSLEREVFAYLSAMDEAQMATATVVAAETGRPQTWRNPETGAAGQSATAAPADDRSPAPGECRDIEQAVTLAGGQQGVKRVRACKGADGRWEIRDL